MTRDYLITTVQKHDTLTWPFRSTRGGDIPLTARKTYNDILFVILDFSPTPLSSVFSRVHVLLIY